MILLLKAYSYKCLDKFFVELTMLIPSQHMSGIFLGFGFLCGFWMVLVPLTMTKSNCQSREGRHSGYEKHVQCEEKPRLACLTNVSGVVQRMNEVRRGCSEICNNDLKGSQSVFFDFIEKQVDCRGLWMNEAIDKAMEEPTPPSWIPEEMVGAFTYGGRVPVRPWPEVLNNRYLGKSAYQSVWSRELVDDWVSQCRSGTLNGNYGTGEVHQLKLGLEQMSLVGASVLVIGSENPWVEACVLNAGAALVTTLEYGEIVSEHPQVKTMTPSQFRERYAEYSEHFDAVVTFSSVEHSGLGRYGDAMNPWGDRQAIARAWCASKRGARLLIAVMTGNDEIVYNAHRVYGSVMYPHLVANWHQVWRASEGGQIVHVLKK